ncbi:MAG: hypothetical protein RLN76_01155 [Phycisphaeraceae bacterium]
MPGQRLAGVLALEQHWSSPLNPGFSIAPALELIEIENGVHPPFLHRRFTHREELARLIHEWIRHGARYPVLHVAGHGQPGVVCTGHRRRTTDRVTLDWLVDQLDGRAARRWIHIGSCATLDLSRSQLQSCAKRSGALGISGFRAEVEFTRSAAWEVLWMQRLAQTLASRRGVSQAIAWARSSARGVFSDLRFTAVAALR